MPNYEVVRLGGGLPVHCPEFGVLVSAGLPTGLDPKQFAVRPVKDPEWRERERARFKDGTYCKPPFPLWVLEELEYNNPDHFLHISVKDPTKVSFTENEEKGAIDRQSAPMLPGRYLERYARRKKWGAKAATEDDSTFLTPDDIRNIAAMLVPVDAVKFAATPEDIERVYVNGPRSCMSGEDEFDSSIHPTRVYGAGDLQVAYLTVNNDQITARALVWPEKKVWGRMYGDEHRLTHALRQLGYDEGSLVGAKLLRVTEGCGDEIVCPYIDYHGYIKDHGTHLTIEESGIEAQSTNGYILKGRECEHCGDYTHEDDVCYFDDEAWCTHCYENNTFYCEGYDEQRRDSEHFGYVQGVGEVCQSYYEEYCFTCDKTGKSYRHDDQDSVTMHDGATWSMSAFEAYGGTCERTDEHYHMDDLVRLEDTLEYVFIGWANSHAYEKDGGYYADDPDQGELELAEAA